MGKLPASLLSIVFHLYLIEAVFGDEEVRKAQEELHKRHLFYGDITGEVSPALTVAISAYQQRKGFILSGQLDLETRASLGLMKTPAKSVRVDRRFAFAAGEEFRGANGEALPESMVAYRSSDDPYIELTKSPTNAEFVALATAGHDTASLVKARRAVNKPSGAGSRHVQPHKETNPLVSAFHTVDHAIRVLVGDTPARKKRAIARRL